MSQSPIKITGLFTFSPVLVIILVKNHFAIALTAEKTNLAMQIESW
jgi:hypothetical protein